MHGAWAWSRAEIRSRWRALVVLALLIGLLAAASMTAFAGARRTASAYGRFREATRAHDVLMTSPDATALRTASRLPLVAAASVITIYPAFIDFESEFDIGVFASHDGELGRSVDVGHVLQGRVPDPDKPEEAALSPQAASLFRAGPGDQVSLQSMSPEQIERLGDDFFSGTLEGPKLQFTVTGVMRNAEDLRGDLASHVIYATPAFHRMYEGEVGKFIDAAAVRLRNGDRDFDRFAAQARDLLGTEGEVSLVGTQEIDQGVEDALRVLSLGLAALGLAALLVGGVAGGQALGRQLAGASVDQAALGALGLTRRSRALAAAMVAVPVAVIAPLAAAAAAVLASPLTPINYARQAEPDPGIAVDPLVHLGGAALVAAGVLVAAFATGWRVARSGPARGERARPGLGQRLAWATGAGPSAVTGVRMALDRGVGRSAVPVRSTLVAATVAVGGLVGAITFGASLDRLATTPSRYGVPWDVRPEMSDTDVAEAAKVRDVGSISHVTMAGVELRNGPSSTAYAINRVKGDVTFTVLDGRLPQGDHEVAVGRDLMRRMRVGKGDTIALKTEEGDRRLTVVGTVLTPSIDQDPVAGGLVVTPATLEPVARSQMNEFAIVNWREGVDHKAATARFKQRFEYTISAYSVPKPPGEVTNLSRVRSLPAVFGAFLATVGVAGLLHALVTSSRRRRHELAVLRAMGFVRRQVGASVAWQSTTIGVVGLVVGLPLGIALGRWVWILVADGVGVATDPRIPALAAGLLVPITLVVANVIAAPLGWRAARVPAATVLRTE